MDAIVDFIIGYADSPIEMAVYFMMFVLVFDSIFSIVTTLINGARR